MPETRKKVREAAVSVLSNATTGFNARVAAKATAYGITAYTIDWSAGSGSFFQAYVEPEDIDLTQIKQWPAVNLYTVGSFHEGRVFGRAFSGTIGLRVDLFLKLRTGVEAGSEIERNFELAEDALITALRDDLTGIHAYGVSPLNQFDVPREAARLLGDGWLAAIPLLFPCEVEA